MAIEFHPSCLALQIFHWVQFVLYKNTPKKASRHLVALGLPMVSHMMLFISCSVSEGVKEAEFHQHRKQETLKAAGLLSPRCAHIRRQTSIL